MPDCSASTNPPLMVAPSPERVNVPVIVPVSPTPKVTPLLAMPPTVTTTGPVAAPAGTGATILVLVQLVGVAVMPLNVTVLLPCVAPKVEPFIVTLVAIGPAAGERLLIDGVGSGRGTTTVESKLPFRVPSTSNSALVLVVGATVKFTPAHT